LRVGESMAGEEGEEEAGRFWRRRWNSSIRSLWMLAEATELAGTPLWIPKFDIAPSKPANSIHALEYVA
jgi:hypothetical protein